MHTWLFVIKYEKGIEVHFHIVDATMSGTRDSGYDEESKNGIHDTRRHSDADDSVFYPDTGSQFFN